MVARRKVYVIRRVAIGSRAHVLRVERVLEREDDAVQWHLLEIGVAPVGGIERGGTDQLNKVAGNAR